jgi:PAS domain S-box-containing protein
MNNNAWLGRMPIKIVACFAVISFLWITCADLSLNIMFLDNELRQKMDLYVGLSYIVVMSVFLYFLLNRYINAIRNHEQNYQVLADSGQALIWTAGTDKLCNYFNKTWLEFTGRTLEQEMGNGWAEGVHPDDFNRCLDIYTSSFDKHEKFSMEYRLRHHDGQYRWLQDDGCPRFDGDGNFTGYIGYCLDINKSKLDRELHKRLEDHLRHSQKMDSIGTLAGGIAHDFNNILTVILGACTLLKMSCSSDPQSAPLLDQINDSAEKAAKLTQGLLAYSRKQTICKQPEDISSVVKTMHDFMARIIGEDIGFSTKLPESSLMVMIDRGQIEQVLMNMAANSRDAMQHGGYFNLTVSQIYHDGTFSGLEECQPGDYALISVSDSGEGIDKETQQRIFEPFFTTKTYGKGTGLGLSMAYGIVRQHDGMIDVKSEPDNGTTFNIYLPLLEQNSDNSSSKSAALLLPKGTETILLVEDDTMVLAINKELLEKAGYFVLSARNGYEALELFTKGSDKIALVVLDVIMPGMNGKEVYEKLREHKNNVKVLFASGYTADILNIKGIIQESMNFISKPLNPPQFLGRVRKLIDC